MTVPFNRKAGQKAKKIIVFGSIVSVLGFAFQNCGGAFEAKQNGAYNLASNGPFTCTSVNNPDPDKSTLYRLNHEEYTNSLRQLIGSNNFNNASLQSALATLSSEGGSGEYDTFTDNTSQDHVETYFRIAEAAGELLSKDSSSPHLKQCGDSSSRSQCLNSFLNSFAPQAFRRPVTADEIQKYSSFVTSLKLADGELDITFAAQAILQSPYFLYHAKKYDSESGMSPSYYLASRLSFMLLAEPPDEELLARAANGSLQQAPVLEEQVNRLLQRPEAKVRFQSFVDDWLEISELPSFASFSQPFWDDLGDRNKAHTDAMNEIKHLVDDVVWRQNGDYKDLLLSRATFPQSTELAKIYETPVWEPGQTPIQLDPAKRAGILTRVALLAADSDESSPFRRGGKVLKRVLCNDLPRPDAEDVDPGLLVEPPFDANLTTRERFHNQTSSTACFGCHQFINPLGFSLGRYDAVGRYTTQELIFNTNGKLVNTLPVDSYAEVQLTYGSPEPVSDGVELSRTIASSEEGQSCFVKQWYRFSQGEMETASAGSGCKLNKMYQSVAGPQGSIQNMIKSTILSEVQNGL